MRSRRLLWYAGLVLLLVAICAVSLFMGDKYAVDHLAIKSVSPDQIAGAMQQDDFFSNYRYDTLLVRGTVTSVRKTGNALVVGLKTDVAFAVSCDLGSYSQPVAMGDTISVMTEGASAEREASAVLLHDCVVP